MATAPTQPTAGSYSIGRPQGRCAACGSAIEPQQKLMAALVETPEGFARQDLDPACWEKFDRKDVVAFWQTTMPAPEQKKKLFVDDGVLCDLFARLADVAEPAKVNFRFVLGLILMRKRLLVYESTRVEDGREMWLVRPKGADQPLEMLNPKLDEDQMREVSQSLGQILNEEL